MGHCRWRVQRRVLLLILRHLSFLLLFLHFWISRFLPGIISLRSGQACRACVVAADPLCFLSLVTVFVSPSSWRTHFCIDSYFFSFQHCKNVMPLLLAFLINSSSPLSNTLFFSGSFKDFFFFSSWIMSTDFFGFTLFEVCWASWSLWKVFTCYFFEYFSALHSFSSSGTSVNCILDFFEGSHPSLGASLVAQWLRLLAMQETQILSLGQEEPLEEGMAIHSSTLAWEFPWTEEPGRLHSVGSHRVGHNWSD